MTPSKIVVDIATTLLKHGAELVARNRTGVTPIHIAAGAGHPGLLQLFFDWGVESLWAAADETEFEAQLQILMKKDPNCQSIFMTLYGIDRNQAVPFHAACTGHSMTGHSMPGRSGALRNMAQREADTIACLSLWAERVARLASVGLAKDDWINIEAAGGYTCVHLLLLSSTPSLGLLRWFKEKGADLNRPAKEGDGDTPLLMAMRRRHDDVVMWLCDPDGGGVDVDARNAVGSTALLLAAAMPRDKTGKPSAEVVHALCNAGAHPAAQAGDTVGGTTPVFMACAMMHDDGARCVEFLEIFAPEKRDGEVSQSGGDGGESAKSTGAGGRCRLRLLDAAGVNKMTTFGQTALLKAVETGSGHDGDGTKTVKSEALEENAVRVVRLLCKTFGADPDTTSRCNKGATALHIACGNASLPLVRELVLGCNADCERVADDGDSPLFQAAYSAATWASRVVEEGVAGRLAEARAVVAFMRQHSSERAANDAAALARSENMPRVLDELQNHGAR
jgi:ankyrin repeat protein